MSELNKDNNSNSFQLLGNNKTQSVSDAIIKESENVQSKISQSNRSAPGNVLQINQNKNIFAKIED